MLLFGIQLLVAAKVLLASVFSGEGVRSLPGEATWEAGLNVHNDSAERPEIIPFSLTKEFVDLFEARQFIAKNELGHDQVYFYRLFRPIKSQLSSRGGEAA
jgi:hypothetical protein